ncbi:MAG: hypothetical protein PHH49_04805 [Candidatus Omnitrophica bacterium]|nr:hypothetical protein [Candidatus Omnitrophota bacterium]MDD5488265.1 hypothetical protein [Candidatus Omnitrophota bacterium]
MKKYTIILAICLFSVSGAATCAASAYKEVVLHKIDAAVRVIGTPGHVTQVWDSASGKWQKLSKKERVEYTRLYNEQLSRERTVNDPSGDNKKFELWKKKQKRTELPFFNI